jgi:ribose transport system permease protein
VAIYFLATGIAGLQLLGAGEWVSDVFYGGALVIAVALSTIVHRVLSGR